MTENKYSDAYDIWPKIIGPRHSKKKKKRKNSNSCYFGEIYHLFDINFKIAQINTFKYNF